MSNSIELAAGLTKNKLFGKPSSEIGNAKSDTVIKTLGTVKVKYGNKYVTIFKDGKLNVEDSLKFIYRAAEVGKKDGLYIIEDGNNVSIFVVSKGQPYPISTSETTYVSFLEELSTTEDLKETALKNIGFLYSDLDEFYLSGVLNSLIYVLSEGKFYVVKNGTPTEFKLDLPTEYDNLIIHNLTSDVIKLGDTIITSNEISFGDEYTIGDVIFGLTETKINNLVSNNIRGSGFKLVGNDLGSYLIIDAVYAKNLLSNSPRYTVYDIIIDSNLSSDNYIFETLSNTKYSSGDVILVLYNKNITKDWILYDTEGNELADTYTDDNGNKLLVIATEQITLIDKNGNEKVYEIGDPLPEYESISSYLYSEIVFKYNGTNFELKLDTSLKTEELRGAYLYKIGNCSDSFISTPLVKIFGNLEIVDFIIDNTNDNDWKVSYTPNKILRIGNLDDLLLSRKDNNSTDVSIVGDGIYSDIGVFKEALYSDNYTLDQDDDSSRFASTEWVLSKLNLIALLSGFYSSITREDNIPINPVYIGTVVGNFTVSENIPYLWYTIDGGKTWELIDEYIPVDTSYYYIRSSLISYTYETDSSSSTHLFPGGFLCWFSQSGSTDWLIGSDGWVGLLNLESSKQDETMSKIFNILDGNALSGVMPDLINGFNILWRIKDTSDFEDPYSWEKISETNLTDFDWLGFNTVCDWDGIPLHNSFSTIDLLNPSNPVDLPEWNIYNESNWTNKSLVRSFVTRALALILKAAYKAGLYSDNTGWNNAWDGPIFIKGPAGYLCGRWQGIQSPTSNDSPNNVSSCLIILYGQLHKNTSTYYWTSTVKIGGLINGYAYDSNIGGSFLSGNVVFLCEPLSFAINKLDLNSLTLT